MNSKTVPGPIYLDNLSQTGIYYVLVYEITPSERVLGDLELMAFFKSLLGASEVPAGCSPPVDPPKARTKNFDQHNRIF